MIGEITALVASGIWVVSSSMFDQINKQVKISPIQISFYRGLIAIPFLAVSLLLTKDLLPILTEWQWTCLILSAIFGITVGDTAFFFSLQYTGVRNALLLQTTTPLFGALFAWTFLQETISSYGLIGIILTLMGIAGVITEQTIEQKANNLMAGVIWGIVSGATQGFGAMLLKLVLNDTNLSPLWSSNIRLLIGTIIIGGWLGLQKEMRWMPNLNFEQWRSIGMASFLGTFIGLWLHQTSFKFAAVGIASTLLNTSPLFALFVGYYLGEIVTWRALFSVMIVILGIGLIFLH